MRLLIAILLLSSCSLIKSNATRCFDIAEKYGSANLYFKENGREIFSCAGE